jgi:hypothetical protein
VGRTSIFSLSFLFFAAGLVRSARVFRPQHSTPAGFPQRTGAMVYSSTEMIYLGLKFFLFFSLVGALVKAEPMRNQIFTLSLLYTAGSAFLSYVFMILLGDTGYWQNSWRSWQIWLGLTFVLSWVYFKCLVWFEESSLFWLVLMLGVAVVFF